MNECNHGEEKIHKQYAELEQLFKEQRAELVEKNSQLKIMLNGFVGQELRNIELKKKIAENGAKIARLEKEISDLKKLAGNEAEKNQG
ncbi:MAG: hypothetical protein J5U17_06830 [Candidatus Methanoperedens sp.]|nr:hypothetical protein [Candidatus Methanoperedens sp.]MCE8425478.1 hypothetical protein [Candidatus Methanoperedens sp.]MCE8427939.1 hypothetical protein [Candidatus Methanoperedens sp.]